MMNLILWESNMSTWPSDPAERMKLINTHIEMTKQDLDSGIVKVWGASPGGGKGFAITEGGGKESLAGLLKYTPYYTFNIAPMLSVDEIVEVMKGMQK